MWSYKWAHISIIAVADITYYIGESKYWKFPLETLYCMGGDCEDTSILYCALAKALGLDTDPVIFEVPFLGHMRAGVSVDGCEGCSFITESGTKYYYCETAAGVNYSVGENPNTYVYNVMTGELIPITDREKV